MSAPLWLAALEAIGIGVATPLVWAWARRSGRLPEMAAGRADFGFHVAAEVAMGVLLLAGGVAMIAAPGARWPRPVALLGFGMLLYSLVESPGHYLVTGHRRLAGVILLSWIAAVPAILILLVAR